MRFKPRSTVKNPRALLYKRFTSVEVSSNISTLYKTVDNKYWTFDMELLHFVQYTDELPANYTKIDVVGIPTLSQVNKTTIFRYGKYYFYYSNPIFGTAEWVRTEDISSLSNFTLLSASFNNIGRYQTNRYYYVGSFDYMIRGSIEQSTTQYVKGNITPLTSFNIKYFEDSVALSVDDLVVIDNRLYSVEAPETKVVRQPAPFNVYYATLNSVL